MNRPLAILASALAGALLCGCAVALAGGGHGTFIPMALVASPTIALSLVFNRGFMFWTGLGLAPLYWH